MNPAEKGDSTADRKIDKSIPDLLITATDPVSLWWILGLVGD